MPRGKTAEVKRAEAHLYLDKAVQFAKAGISSAIQEGRIRDP